MSDFWLMYSDVIRLALGVALASLAMSIARDALFETEDSDDEKD